jgi:hypothetical protein
MKMENHERHQFKGRIAKMEVVPNLCASNKATQKDHAGKT